LSAAPSSGILTLMARTIGLSGGIGSGKSTVSRMLQELGAALIDADAIVHELQAPGTPLLAEIRDAFGGSILDAAGALDRKALGAIVFADPDARALLGQLVHPRVGEEMVQRSRAAVAAGNPLIVLDIPLLFEGRAAGTGTSARMSYDSTLLVWVPQAVQLSRTMARDRCSREEAQARIDAQMPLDEKRELADAVIDNAGALAETQRQVEAFFREVIAS